MRVVRELRPDVVLCPDPTAVFFGDGYFNHRDHRVTGWATLDAVAPAAGNPHYFPEHLAEGLAVHQVRAVYLSGTLEPNCWVDIADDARAQDRRAVLPRQPARRDRRLVPRVPARARRGRPAPPPAIRYAEAFRRLTLGELTPAAPSDGRRSAGSWRRHSAMARSTSTATMPTPPGADDRADERADELRGVGVAC